LTDGLKAEVIEDDQRRFFEPVQPFDDVGQGDLLAESVEVKVERAVAVGAGVIAQRAGQVRLSAAGCAGDEDVLLRPIQARSASRASCCLERSRAGLASTSCIVTA